jgi:hypothetical protein
MGYGGRGGYPPMQAPYGSAPSGPGYSMGGPNMYPPVQYGRGYPPQQQQQQGYGAPQQGMSKQTT